MVRSDRGEAAAVKSRLDSVTAAAKVIRDAVFSGPTSGPSKLGAEVELLALDVATHRVAWLETELSPIVMRVAQASNWEVIASPKGAPRFRVPGGGHLSFEPGGQIEYASAPHASTAELLAELRRVIEPITLAASDTGIELVGAGIDPYNPLDESPLQLDAERYVCMDEYFATLGTSGRRMMRQTAAVQLNIDAGEDPGATWRFVNGLAPWLTAIFANSRVYARCNTQHASFRARTWQRLDPSRTGLAFRPSDAQGGYADFALAANAMFMRTAEGGYAPFREWVERAPVDRSSILSHLSTLFPEIRPRGSYFEIRSIDALPLEAQAAPILLVAGLLADPQTTSLAAEITGEPSPDRLARAARLGLSDPELCTGAAELVRLALQRCEQDGTNSSPQDLDAAHLFFERYTLRGRCPGDDAAASLVATAA
jgi:glutamate--cysteine ligase